MPWSVCLGCLLDSRCLSEEKSGRAYPGPEARSEGLGLGGPAGCERFGARCLRGARIMSRRAKARSCQLLRGDVSCWGSAMTGKGKVKGKGKGKEGKGKPKRPTGAVASFH